MTCNKAIELYQLIIQNPRTATNELSLLELRDLNNHALRCPECRGTAHAAAKQIRDSDVTNVYHPLLLKWLYERATTTAQVLSQLRYFAALARSTQEFREVVEAVTFAALEDGLLTLRPGWTYTAAIAHLIATYKRERLQHKLNQQKFQYQ